MDLFKKQNSKKATNWDWDVPQYTKRAKGDTQKLHNISRAKLKEQLKKEIQDED